jgi:hypothetical protein
MRSIFVTVLMLLCQSWAAPKYRVLHSFGIGQDGAGVWSSLTLDERGNIYGSTIGGGVYHSGTIFELAPTSKGGWVETVVHSFKFPHDGESPNTLTLDSKGNLYGTASNGGTHHAGTAFKLTHASNSWSFSVIYNFCDLSGCADGGEPRAGLVLGKTGHLYGTTYGGGSESGGVAFELKPGRRGWTEDVVYAFGSQMGDGGLLVDGLTWDEAGNLYGANMKGGIPSCSCGTVFELMPGLGGWTEQVLHSFRGLAGGGMTERAHRA